MFNGFIDVTEDPNRNNGSWFRWKNIKFLLLSWCLIIIYIWGRYSRFNWSFLRVEVHYLQKFLLILTLVCIFLSVIFNGIYYNYIYGGQLILHLNNPSVLNCDNDPYIAYVILSTLICFALFVNTFLTILQEVIEHDRQIGNILVRILFTTIFFAPTNYFICIYSYVMTVYCKQINLIRKQNPKLICKLFLLRSKFNVFF